METIKRDYRESARRYRNSLTGFVKIMFWKIKRRIKHDPKYIGKELTFGIDEFVEFAYNSKTKAMLDKYIASGKKRSLAPSVDRIDNRRGYSLDNIQIITVGENSRKAVGERMFSYRGSECCIVDGCGGQYVAKGLCRKHYDKDYILSEEVKVKRRKARMANYYMNRSMKKTGKENHVRN